MVNNQQIAKTAHPFGKDYPATGDAVYLAAGSGDDKKALPGASLLPCGAKSIADCPSRRQPQLPFHFRQTACWRQRHRVDGVCFRRRCRGFGCLALADCFACPGFLLLRQLPPLRFAASLLCFSGLAADDLRQPLDQLRQPSFVALQVAYLAPLRCIWLDTSSSIAWRC
jgi:hypothetical protein